MCIEKVRWCFQGHHDPDLFDLRRHSFTHQIRSISLFLVIAAGVLRKVGEADAQIAFMQTSNEINSKECPSVTLTRKFLLVEF